MHRSTYLIAGERAGEDRVSCLAAGPGKRNRHGEVDVALRDRARRDCSRSELSLERSRETFSPMLQAEHGGKFLLFISGASEVDGKRPSSRSVRTSASDFRSRPEIDRPAIDKDISDAPILIENVASRDREIRDLAYFDRTELRCHTQDFRRP